MCLKAVGGNNFIFYVIYKWKMTVISSRILAIFLHFCEVLNILYKNETYCFLTIFTFTSQLLVKLKLIQCGQYGTNVSNLLKTLLHVECYSLVMRYIDCKVSKKLFYNF